MEKCKNNTERDSGKLRIELVSLNRNFYTVEYTENGETLNDCDFDDDWDHIHDVILDKIKCSDADLLVFAGGAIKEFISFYKLKKKIYDLKKHNILKNPDIVIVIEDWGSGNIMHLVNYYDDRNNLVDLNRFKQKFSSPSDLSKSIKEISEEESYKDCRDSYMNELYEKTIVRNKPFMVKGKRCAIIQCGEINFLESCEDESHNYNVKVRGNEMDPYIKDFDVLLNDQVDVFLNVIHTPIENLPIIEAKWKYLSETPHGMACLAVRNCLHEEGSCSKFSKERKCALAKKYGYDEKRMIYYERIGDVKDLKRSEEFQNVYVNGVERDDMKAMELHVTPDYISKVFEI